MRILIIFAFIFHLPIVLAQAGYEARIIIPAVAVPSFFVLCSVVILLVRYCNKQERQKHPIRYVNNSNTGTQVTIDQPPPYSADMRLYHTQASGQPMISGNLMQGFDNPALLNRNISNISNLPNRVDLPSY